MSIYRFLYRLVAGFWLVIGALTAITVFVYVVAFKVIDSYISGQFPWMHDIIGKWLANFSPGILHIMGILLGLFCLYFGGELLLFRPWTRTVGIGFHLGMGMFMIALSITIYELMTNSPLINSTLDEFTPVLLLGFGLVVGIGLVALGFQMGSRTAITIFTGEEPAQVALPKAICPTCGHPLDVNKEMCPVCDAAPDQMLPPSKPRLVDLSSGKEYPVSTVRALTYIGRKDSDASVQFEDTTVSKDHAVIEYTDGSFFLHARQDSNGTFVNNEKIRDKEIVHNDIIRFGRVQVKFIAGE